MSKLLSKHILLLAIFALLSATMSSVTHAHSGVFFIKVSGDLEKTIFSFYSSDHEKGASREKIILLAVQKRTENGWGTIWNIRGEGFASSIVYGSIPVGMRQIVKPVKFAKDCVYRVVATSESGSGPNLYASSYFTFDDIGNATLLR